MAANVDVPLLVLQKKRNATKDPKKRSALKLQIDDLLKKRKLVDDLFNEIIVRATDNTSERIDEVKTSKFGLNLEKYPCYKKLYTTFSNNCFNFSRNPYALVHLRYFANICSMNWFKKDKVIKDIKSACSDVLGSMKPKNIM